MNRPIFLLSDFGTRDSYVGQVKAVLASIAPGSPVFDLTHDVEPYAVDEGAWLLETSLPYLPEDAVVFAVVDPGVGTARRALVVRAGGRHFVGPDNGILSGVLPFESRGGIEGALGTAPVAGDVAIHELCSPQYRLSNASATFHGRDVFAPAAAHLAAGLDMRHCGPPLADMLAFPVFGGRPAGFGRREGYVVHIDRFGSLLTTIRAAELFPCFELTVGNVTIDRRVRTFANAGRGELFCHADSSGFIAVATNGGSAAQATGARRGDPVVLRCR
jgi:S-adenosylmethionine hydrolase